MWKIAKWMVLVLVVTVLCGAAIAAYGVEEVLRYAHSYH